MQLGLFLDLDGTARESTDGKFIQTPKGQQIMPGVHEAITSLSSANAHHKRQGYTIIGITNQGGCDTINRDTGKPLKSIEDAIAEQHYTLELIPQLEVIYFCPDMKGLVVYRVTRNDAVKLADHTPDGEFLKEKFRYRKPGAGMIFQAVFDFGIDLTKSWMIGDRDEDEKAAKAAGVSFFWADVWRMRFTPGMYEIKSATPQQIEFLEGINLN